MLFRLLLTAVAVLLLTGFVSAEDTGEFIARAKRATVFIQVGRESGTAFCIDEGGLLVTNAHVVAHAASDGKVRVVIEPGESTEKAVEGHVLRVNKIDDLALVLIGEHLPALKLGSTNDVYETASVTAFGYPFGKLLNEGGADTSPNVSVSTGHVTALRKKDGVLEHVQLDASLNPGNSGGPVLDQDHKVIGIVQAGIYGASINIAIPVEKLLKMLQTPVIVLPTKNLASDQRSKPLDFSFQVFGSEKTRSDLRVSLLLQEAGGDHAFPAQQVADGYHVSFIPVPANRDTRQLQLTVETNSGPLALLMRDIPFRCGDRQLRLADVHEIQLTGPAHITLNDGTQISGALTGFGVVDVEVNGLPMKLDLSLVKTATIASPDSQPVTVYYRVVASRAGSTVAEASGMIAVEAAPAAKLTAMTVAASRPAMPAPAPLLLAEKLELRTPSRIDDAIVGCNGRLLLLPMKQIHKIGVFDVRQAKITSYLEAPSDDYLLAVGADRYFIAYPAENRIERWNLTTFQREAEEALPRDLLARQMTTGPNAAGPIVLVCANAKNLQFVRFLALSPTTLKEIAPESRVPNGLQFLHADVHFRASGDGTLFTSWVEGGSPSGLRVSIWDGSKFRHTYRHESAGFVLPGPEAEYVYTEHAGIFNQALQPHESGRPNQQSIEAVIPCLTTGYYIAIRKEPTATGVQFRLVGAIHHISVDPRLLDLPSMDEMIGDFDDFRAVGDFTWEKRIQFIPAENVLVTIPSSNDRLVIRKLNLLESLDRQNIDYLFVTSTPPTHAAGNEEMRYPIAVKSHRGSVSFTLESGPVGMAVAKNGVVSWHTPEQFAATVVVISIKDGTGQEIYHTFQIAPK